MSVRSMSVKLFYSQLEKIERKIWRKDRKKQEEQEDEESDINIFFFFFPIGNTKKSP